MNFEKKKIMLKVGFIGSGRMCSAIVKGALNSGKFSPQELGCTDN